MRIETPIRGLFCRNRHHVLDKRPPNEYILQCAKRKFGALAQLGERLHGMEEVESSILLRSTKLNETPSIRAVFYIQL